MRTFAAKGRKKLRSVKRSLPSLPYTRGLSIRRRPLRLSTEMSIPGVCSPELPAETGRVRVCLDSLGRSHAGLVVLVAETAAAGTDGGTGVDRGLSQIATGDRDGYRPFATSAMAPGSAGGGIGAAKAEPLDHALRVGRQGVLVPPACTTTTRSRCLVRTRALPPGEPVLRCPVCGFTAGGGRNAVKVILAMAGLNHGHVDAV
jgi:hypothetical protein